MIKMLSCEDVIRPSWSYQSTIDSSLDDVCFHGLAIEYEMADSKLFSIFPSDVCYDKLSKYPHQIRVDLSPSSTEVQLFKEVEDYFDWMKFEGQSKIDFGTCEKKSLVFPKEDTKTDDELSIRHLLKAIGEAKENQYNDLAYVISKKLEEKACPKGSILHRLAYYLTQTTSSSLDQHYLAQEANKHYGEALSIFYQLFPCGKLAHFVANSSIIEAIPSDAKTINIVDFDMGDGLQWPPLIESISKRYPKVVVRLISLKWDDNHKNTKKWLYEHANTYSCGLAFKVEEMGIEELALEMKKIGNLQGRENWVAFNCMKGLPHMKNRRNFRNITKFLNLARECIREKSNIRGILTLGSGNFVENNEIGYQAFSSIFEAELRRITNLLESMEIQMPSQFSEARVAMECLFVAPYLSLLAKMDERELRDGLVPKMGLEARRISKGIIEEAKELTREESAIYCIRTEGENENELILSYKDTPLVRVSSWS